LLDAEKKKGEMQMKSKVIAGIIVTMFLVTIIFSGIPVRAAAKTLRIGVVGPKGMIQWDGLWEGAQLARDTVNDAGGFVVGADTYTIVLVDIDSHAYPVIQPDLGVAALEAALATDLDFIIGGFRTECVFPMVEAFVAYCDELNDTAAYPQPVWYIAGAATDSLMAGINVSDPEGSEYDTYRYMFRVTPMSSSFLVGSLIYLSAGWILAHQLVPLYGLPVNAYIVAENLVWCDLMPGAFLKYLAHPTSVINIAPGRTGDAGPFCNFVGLARPAWDETDYSAILSDIEAKNCKIVFHVYSALGGAPFIKQFGERKTGAVAVGINVESQRAEFYDTIGGKCNYETFLASVGTRTPIWESLGWGTATQDFWDDYSAEFGHSPIYTAWGAYDGIMGFTEFMEDQASWPMAYDDYIPLLEVQQREGLLGKFKFNDQHDVYAQDLLDTWPEPHWVRVQIPQWQDNRLEIVWPRDQMYSRKYKIPPWMYKMTDQDWFGALGLSPPYDPTIGPDGLVDTGDLYPYLLVWQGAPYPMLEADMDGNNFINILDVSKVAIAIPYSASLDPDYGQWPLP
jgi:hypothetical protein